MTVASTVCDYKPSPDTDRHLRPFRTAVPDWSGQGLGWALTKCLSFSSFSRVSASLAQKHPLSCPEMIVWIPEVVVFLCLCGSSFPLSLCSFYYLLFSLCVCVHTWRSGVSQRSPSSLCLPGIEPRSSGCTAVTFAH